MSEEKKQPKPDSYVVKTFLHTTSPCFKLGVEEIVQSMSMIETLGNLVTTHTILRALELNIDVQHVFEQMFVNTCWSSLFKPSGSDVVSSSKFVPDNLKPLICVARDLVVSGCVLNNITIPANKYLSRVQNGCARRYATMCRNHVLLRFSSMQTKGIEASLSLINHGLTPGVVKCVKKSIARQVNGEDPVPLIMFTTNRGNQEAAIAWVNTDAGQHVLSQHVNHASPHVPSPKNLDKFAATFLPYLRYCMGTVDTFNQTLDLSTAAGRKKYIKSTKLLPQLTAKVRSVQFGKNETSDLVKRMIHLDMITEEHAKHIRSVVAPEPPTESVQTPLSVCSGKRKRGGGSSSSSSTKRQKKARKPKPNINCKWLSKYAKPSQELLRIVFDIPKRLQDKFADCVTSDGVAASWMCHRPKRTSNADVPHHAVKASDGNFVTLSQAEGVNIIAVDPGHANIITATRMHFNRNISYPNHPALTSMCRMSDVSAHRKRKFKTKIALWKSQRSEYILTNRRWREICGRRSAHDKTLATTDRLGLQPSYQTLSENTSTTISPTVYSAHMTARLTTIPALRTRMVLKSERRTKMHTYSMEQQAMKTLACELTAGLDGSSIVVWGNGGFGPTSFGHASAPNLKLRKSLATFIPVVVSSEFRSSQRSACCHSSLDNLRYPGQTRRTMTKRCTRCAGLMSRDRCAAHVILDIFQLVPASQEDVGAAAMDHELTKATNIQQCHMRAIRNGEHCYISSCT